MTGPSDKALEALQARSDELIDYWDLSQMGREVDHVEKELLGAAYPIIRADVVMEVVEALREKHRAWPGSDDDPTNWSIMADFIEREFGETS